MEPAFFCYSPSSDSEDTGRPLSLISKYVHIVHLELFKKSYCLKTFFLI